MVLARAWRSLPDWPHAELGPGCPARPSLVAAVSTWSRGLGGLALLGRTGAGKSTAIVAGARRILRVAEHRSLTASEMAFAIGIRWARPADLVAACQSHPLGSRGDPPAYRAAERATLLLLDEVGYEPDDPRHRVVARLMEQRYDRPEARTWITSGLTPAGFVARYGSAVARKAGIGDGARGVVVEVE